MSEQNRVGQARDWGINCQMMECSEDRARSILDSFNADDWMTVFERDAFWDGFQNGTPHASGQMVAVHLGPPKGE